MKIIRQTIFISLLLILTFSCDSKDENEDGNQGDVNTVTFLDITKDVIGGCTVQTFDEELGILCTFTLLYQLEDADITISAVVPGSCDQELDDILQMSDNFIADNIKFGVSVI